MTRRALVSLCLLVPVITLAARADDWPQWLGPRRDAVWRERGVVTALPENGLPVKWRVPVKGGYSGPAVAAGRVYITDYDRRAGELANAPNDRTLLEGSERILCLDAATGELIWKHEQDCPYSISYAAGPRCTPTVADGRVYALGAEGNLTCLDAKTGAVVWAKDFKKDYGAPVPIWGFCGHPLVEGDLLVCLVGGPGSVAVAFDKATGAERWRALTASESGYCPPTIIEAGGRRQLVIWDADNLNALDPATGAVLWSQPLKPMYGMSIMAPQVADTPRGRVLFVSGIGRVGALYALDPERPAAKLLWRGEPKSAVYCANSTPFIAGDTLYGCDCDTGMLTAVALADGRRLWETLAPTTGGDRRGKHGTAFLVRQAEPVAGDPPGTTRTWIFSETGDLVLARLSPERYEELGRRHLLDPTNECFGRDVVWSHPAFAGGCIFARNDRELVCVALAAENHLDAARDHGVIERSARDDGIGRRAGTPPEASAARIAPPHLAFPGEKIDTWHGHRRHSFEFQGRKAWVVEPAEPLPGNPWSWCMMFPDAFTTRCAAPQLLGAGLHHSYLDVGNTFGSPAAIEALASFRDELVRRGLATRATLIGISRGGLYAHRYAAEHPDHVAVIYGDNPVCDFKSWPGGKGTGKGSPRDWATCLTAYGFADEAAALAYPGNPVDALPPLAQAGIAIIDVVGDRDDVVPPAENALLVAERYRKLGGTIEVIRESDKGHHPHGLANPRPVVDFILTHATKAGATAGAAD